MKKNCFFVWASIFILMIFVSSNTRAATKTWNKTNGGAWSTATNWTPNVVPVAGDDVIINSAQSANITAVPPITLNSLTVSGTCTLAGAADGNTITITTTFSVSAGITFSMSSTVGNRMNFTLSSTATGTITGTVSMGPANYTFTDNGNLIIPPAGSFTGTGNFTLNSGATLQIGNTAGISTTGATGAIMVTGTRTFATGANYVYNGTAAQTAGNGLTQNTPSNLTINNAAGVSLSAATTISGLLTMTTGALNMADLALTVGSLTGSGNLTNSNGGTTARTITIGSDNTSPAAYSGIISNGTNTGGFSLTKTGTGTLTLTGLNSYTGQTSISNGMISINTLQNVSGGASSLGNPGTSANGTIAISGTATLQYTGSGHSSDRILNITSDGATIDASGSGTLYLSGGITGTNMDVILAGNYPGTAYETGIIATGNATLTKNGSGVWTLSGANTYTGITTINNGIIKFGAHATVTSSGPLGTTAGGTVINSGGTLDLAGWSENVNETLTLNGIGQNGWGALRNSGGADTYAGLITLGSSSSIWGSGGTIAITNTGTITGAGCNLTLEGTQGGSMSSIIGTGTGTLTKDEPGTWTLSAANTFTGLTTVLQGTLLYGVNNALNSTNVTVSGGTLDLSSYSESATGTLTVANGATLRIGGTNTMPIFTTGYSFGNTSTVEYYGSNQSVAVQPYGNLLISGTGNKTLAGNMSVKGVLVVSLGTILQVGPLRQLTVNGNTSLNGAGSMLIQSDATGTGSFIDNGTIIYANGGSAACQRYLTTNIWHYVSSPISNGIANIFFADYLRTSDPTTSTGWGGWITSTSTPLQVARGYACWKPSTNPGLETFTGLLNTGNQSISLNRTAANPWAGWNLAGNPYPSSVDLASAGMTWNQVEPTAWFWTGSVYQAYPAVSGYGTHSQYVSPDQGFYVHVNALFSGNTNLTFTNAARVHSTESFLKDRQDLKNAFVMNVLSSVNSLSDAITVQFNPDATSDYDPGYDAYKLEGLSEAPQLYTTTGDTKVCCNSLPFVQKNMTIPMGFSCGLQGTYTLSADNLNTFGDKVRISLEDLKLNITQDLRSNPVYPFTYDTLDDPNRFLLHFDDPDLGIGNQAAGDNVNVYSYGNRVYVSTSSAGDFSGNVFVYDLLGREMYQSKLSGNSLQAFCLPSLEGYYIVKVISNQGVASRKIFL
jgi:autotransporter-associated beta strand protein